MQSNVASSSSSCNSMLLGGGPWTVGRKTVHFEEVIAEGGFGVVFLVKHKDSGRRYALKRMYVNNDKDLAVCKREISIVSNLNGHPNLIGYVDSTISLLDGGVHEVLLLMPYHKVTLLQMMNDRLNSGRFTEGEVLEVFCDVCRAVSRLHHCQTPIIHRDLKVENILKSESGSYVLCDFGSATAKVLNPRTQGIGPVEEEIKRYTTLSYRSPEMVDLYSETPLTAKLDIWALGIMLYKLCFFTLPFGESSLAIQSGNVTFPSSSSYSEDMHNLIRYILTVDADTRPDIFQVSHLSHNLAKKKCDIQNLHNVPLLTLDDLRSRLKKSPSSENATAPSNSSRKEADLNRTPVMSPQQPQSLPPSTGGNTSVAPRQRPRGSKPAAAKSILPLPPASPSTNNTGEAPTTKQIVQHPPSVTASPGAAPAAQEKNPFKANFVPAPSETGPAESLPPQTTNPFRSSAGTNSNPGPSSWNPFEDRKMFGQLSEEALFGEQFDQLRKAEASNNNTTSGRSVDSVVAGGSGKVDPFRSAPFATASRNE